MKIRSVAINATCLATLISLSPAPALAWGNEGHEIVARIAQKFLNHTTDEKITAILVNDPAPDIVEAATWLDQVRRIRPQTAPWHFTDIDVRSSSYNASRDCPDDACSIAQITVHENQLKAGSLSASETDEALKVIIHVVGDLHQPLHDAHRLDESGQSDRGGNEVEVRFQGKLRNLHSVWDTYLVRELMDEAGFGIEGTEGNEQVTAYADELAMGITPAIRQGCEQGGVEDWANDAFVKAKQVAYGKLPKPNSPVKNSDRLVSEIGPKYQAAAKPVIEGQLRCGGVRLAKILNETFP